MLVIVFKTILFRHCLQSFEKEKEMTTLLMFKLQTASFSQILMSRCLAKICCAVGYDDYDVFDRNHLLLRYNQCEIGKKMLETE